MAKKPGSEDGGARVRVMVELRVPTGEPLKEALAETPAFASTGFTLDSDYEPIPMSPPPALAAAMDAAQETLALVRGMVEEGRLGELEADDKVVSVWRDSPIAPFG